eukprot:TRINITY_DN3354_c0_g3_i1.p1 TRINITY_DN3354_c0_g3~~TRINITY_DN3354_c0_g3_i1.p1  ORF type:complete len:108 (-),score=7.47 TRINITY_DN3354_c0_g3_i1:621-944(-)
MHQTYNRIYPFSSAKTIPSFRAFPSIYYQNQVVVRSNHICSNTFTIMSRFSSKFKRNSKQTTPPSVLTLGCCYPQSSTIESLKFFHGSNVDLMTAKPYGVVFYLVFA